MPNYDNISGIKAEAASAASFKGYNSGNFAGYEISNLMYPSDLQEEKYGGHRVMFMINVMGGGNIVQQGTEHLQDIPPNKLTKGFAGEKIGDASKAMLQAVKNGTAIAADWTADKAGYQTDMLKRSKKYDFSKTKKRLTAAISLYVPEALNKNYSVDWSMESGASMMMGEGISQGLLKAGEELANSKAGMSLEGLGNGTVGLMKAAAAAGKVGASVGASLVLNEMRYVQKGLGMTPGNSKAQLLFNSVDFGGFTFDYKFAPRDEAEAKNVLNIIRTFRHHMLPEFFDDAQFLYIYPSEFDIAYYFGTEENPHLEKHITAVLTNLSVNYNPNGQFMTFSNGMPTHINLTLQFKELGMPSKETSPSNESGA